MSLGTKKKDNKVNKEPEGAEASADYMIEGVAGGEKSGASVTTTKRQEQFESAATQAVSGDKIPSSSSQEYVASSTITEIPQQQQREQRELVNRALDETRDNIRRSIDEARSKIPNYTQAINEYQEQSLQTSREIADNYIESQKEIINLLQSSWIPQIEAANRILTSNWISPRHFTGIYENMVSNIADNMITTTRLLNNMMLVGMNVFRFLMPQLRDNAKEFSRIGVNTARTFEQTSRETAANTAARLSGRYNDNTAT
jgi:hypothetical protein